MNWVKENSETIIKLLFFFLLIGGTILAFESGFAQMFLEKFSNGANEDYTPGENFPYQ